MFNLLKELLKELKGVPPGTAEEWHDQAIKVVRAESDNFLAEQHAAREKNSAQREMIANQILREIGDN